MTDFTLIRYCTAVGKHSSSSHRHFLHRKNSHRGKVFWLWLKTGGHQHRETGWRTTVVTVFRRKTAWYNILRESEVLQWLGSTISLCDSFMANNPCRSSTKHCSDHHGIDRGEEIKNSNSLCQRYKPVLSKPELSPNSLSLFWGDFFFFWRT